VPIAVTEFLLHSFSAGAIAVTEFLLHSFSAGAIAVTEFILLSVPAGTKSCNRLSFSSEAQNLAMFSSFSPYVLLNLLVFSHQLIPERNIHLAPNLDYKDKSSEINFALNSLA
jgi:hypothetical protein